MLYIYPVLMYVYLLRKEGQRLGRLVLAHRHPLRGQLDLEWAPRGRAPGVVAVARLLAEDGQSLAQPLDVFAIRVRAGMMLMGTEVSFRSERPKAKAQRSRQSWYCVHEPLDIRYDPMFPF